MESLWILSSIIVVNLLLSGDNALVIALASRSLPHKQQKQAIFWGTFGAIGLRIFLTILAVYLLEIPYVQAIGGLFLIWVAVKLVWEQDEKPHVSESGQLGEAIRIIISADVVMSLDNVLAVAGVAKGNWIILILGLLISIPIIMIGSNVIKKLMVKWPMLIAIGGGFLGYTAGEMILSDEKIITFLKLSDGSSWLMLFEWIPWVLAIVVFLLGRYRQR